MNAENTLLVFSSTVYINTAYMWALYARLIRWPNQKRSLCTKHTQSVTVTHFISFQAVASAFQLLVRLMTMTLRHRTV